MDKNYNLDEFDPVSLDQWKERIVKDLKGKSIESLNYKVEEGLVMSPFHHKNKREKPKSYPYTQDFEIQQKFNFKKSNTEILEALNNGVNAIELGKKARNLKENLNNVQLDFISIHLDYTPSLEAIEYICSSAKNPKSLRGSFRLRPLTNKLFGLEYRSISDYTEFISKVHKLMPEIALCCVDVRFIYNNGGDTTDELSIAISMAHSYLNFLLVEGYSIEECSKMIYFKLATSSSFFKEIAKYKSLRLMWSKILLDYGLKPDALSGVKIQGDSGLWNKTTMDSITNTLRLTTETLSGILGNVNSFSTLAYDSIVNNGTTESLRISRNIQHILLEESYVKKVQDIASGSYYLESLIDKLCQKAWSMFAEIESVGGVVNISSTEFLEGLEKKRTEKIALYEDGDKILLGVNKYQNLKDKKKQKAKYKGNRIAEKWEAEL